MPWGLEALCLTLMHMPTQSLGGLAIPGPEIVSPAHRYQIQSLPEYPHIFGPVNSVFQWGVGSTHSHLTPVQKHYPWMEIANLSSVYGIWPVRIRSLKTEGIPPQPAKKSSNLAKKARARAGLSGIYTCMLGMLVR